MGSEREYASRMRRAVLLVVGVVAVALVAIAVVLPRYGCPEGLVLFEGSPPPPLPQNETPECLNLSPIVEVTTDGDDLVRDSSDSLGVKLGIAAIGMILGALAVYGLARGRRASTGLTENP
jgi:ABC-type glycerol-3-phosphate transport system permease component